MTVITYTVGTTNVWVRGNITKGGVVVASGTPGQTVEMCVVPDGAATSGWATVTTWVDGYPAIKQSMLSLGVFHVWGRVTTTDEGPVLVDCGTYTVTPD
jgi:hypothetical protein